MDAAFDIGQPGSEPVTLWWLDRLGTLQQVRPVEGTPEPGTFEHAAAARGALAVGRLEHARGRGSVRVLPAGEAAALPLGKLLDALDRLFPRTRWYMFHADAAAA